MKNIQITSNAVVQKSLDELSVLSDKRLADLETLLHCIFLVTTDIMWLFEEEEIDITRDITSKSLGVRVIYNSNKYNSYKL